MKKQRLNEISIVSIVFCIMVICIHASSEAVTLLSQKTAAYFAVMVPWRIAGCAVPGFVFLSGLKFTLNHGINLDYFSFMRKRFLSIIVPYIIYVAVYYCYFIVKDSMSFTFASLLKYIISGDLVAHMYFIIVIAQFYILAPFWNLLLKKLDSLFLMFAALAITVAVGFVFPSIYSFDFSNRLLTKYLFFWIFGCIAAKNYENFKKCLLEKTVYIALLFTLFAVVDVSLYIKAQSNLLLIFREIVRPFFCTTAILFVYRLSIRNFEVYTLPGMWESFSCATYGIYLLHPLVI